MRILLTSSATRRSRRGLSILEVLVSSFILLFGLMGVAAMFPVGQFYVSEATRHDMAAAVGQAAFNDIQVRGLLNPKRWTASGDTTYLIDPLGVPSLSGQFPRTGMSVLTRVAFNDISEAAADSIFRSRDDLVVDLPDDPDEPAKQQVSGPTRSFNGHYSWMFTAQAINGSNSEQFRVSVIVHHKRVLDPDMTTEEDPDMTTEERVTVKTVGGGLGGGAFQLEGTEEQLELAKPGQWMMLYGGGNFKWYRIIAADEVEGTGTATRWVTLQGPDWNGTPEGAVLLEGAVAVYEKVMQRAADP